jgi:predicted secreted Zn-dependent protease
MILRASTRCGCGTSAACVLAFCAAPLFAAEIEAPSIRDSVDYRDVSGDTETALVAALKGSASADSAGDRFFAHTHWRLTWNFRVESGNGSCRLASATTELDVDMTLPRWDAPPSASPELVKRWNTFMKALRKHEDGHRDIAVAAANAIEKHAVKAAPETSCEMLKKTLSQIADSTLHEYRDRENSYDTTTMHGRTQGATFP